MIIHGIEISGSAVFIQQEISGDGNTTIDWNLGNKVKFNFGAQSENFSFVNPIKPCNLLLILVQDSGGNRTANFSGNILWSNATSPTLSTVSGSIDIVSFYYDGTNYYGVASLDFA